MRLSETDIKNLELIRKNISQLVIESKLILKSKSTILDVAPNENLEVKNLYHSNYIYHSLALEDEYKPTFVGDITKYNPSINEDFYDGIFLLEVLEHVNNPFDAIKELYRILKPSGVIFISTPFNFRIHGPLPDNFRFTEHGLRYLLREFTKVKINPLNDPDRPLMPIHYTVIAIK